MVGLPLGRSTIIPYQMKREIISELYQGFEAAAIEVDGVECWSARDLQPLLRYSKWENFSKVIEKAKEACRYRIRLENTE